MTREETKKIIRIMVDSYPNYKPDNISETINVWEMMLDEYTYEQVAVALKSYILSDRSGFAPSIGQLIDKMQVISQPQELNEMEAWSLVSRAIRRSGYYSAEEFKNLPPLVQKAVGLPDQLRIWALDENYNETVIMSNFMRSYREEVSKKRERLKLPSEIRTAIEKSKESSYLAQIEQKRQTVINSADERKQIEDRAKYESAEGVPMPDKCKEIVEKMKRSELDVY